MPRIMVPNAHVYDATNPKARDFYWNNLVGTLFSQGWDAFWLDSAEPEEYWPHMGDAILQDKQLAIGSGARYTNIFPLMHTMESRNTGRRRPIRSGCFCSRDQRSRAAAGRSDSVVRRCLRHVLGTEHQVAGGLNFALSGHPYWTTDIGGYWQPYDNAAE